MSHGQDDTSFFTSDNNYLTVHDVVECFNNRECLILKGKPKIFIFQYVGIKCFKCSKCYVWVFIWCKYVCVSVCVCVSVRQYTTAHIRVSLPRTARVFQYAIRKHACLGFICVRLYVTELSVYREIILKISRTWLKNVLTVCMEICVYTSYLIMCVCVCVCVCWHVSPYISLWWQLVVETIMK